MQDLRDAYRSLRTAPIVSAVAILSLALGIGANTAIFSILDSLLLKPLPVREPRRLVALASAQPTEYFSVSYAVWRQTRDRRLLDDAFAWTTDRVNASSSAQTDFLEAVWATGDFFEALGVPAIAGRTFGEADDRRGGGPDGPVAVISYGLWQRRFGGARDAVGRTLTIERVPFTIVGVTPPAFFGVSVGRSFDVVLPLETEPLTGHLPQRLDSRYWPWLQIMGRLSPSRTLDATIGKVRAAQPQIRDETMPEYDRAEDRDGYLRTPWILTSAAMGTSSLRTRYGPALATLLALVAVVLLVACANIANLQLARMAARRFEFSVRVALGASRARLVRQLLVESLLLSAAGAGLGFALARWGSRFLVGQLSTWAYTAFLDLSADWRVLGATAAVAVATAILFGTVPALRAARVDPIEAMNQQRGPAGDARSGLSGGLVIAQVALSLVLVAGAALFLRSFVALAYRDLGFDRGRLLIAVVDARRSPSPQAERGALYERLREAAERVPGVERAAISMATPLGSAGVRFTPGITAPESAGFAGRDVRILTTPVSPGWFRTYGTRLVAGRDFSAADRRGAKEVVIVNDAFIRRYLNGENALGRTIVEASGTARRTLEIVGVVENAAFASVRDPIEPTLYRPFAQFVEPGLLARIPTISLSVRAAAGPPSPLMHGLAIALGSVDPDVSVTFQTVTEQLSVFYIRERLLALLSGFFGAVALLLAALGLYGVTAYSVARRRTEIGIRMALGAGSGRVLRLVLGRVAALVCAGLIVGGVLSFWAARFCSASSRAIR